MLITPFTEFTDGHNTSVLVVLCVVSVYAADAQSVCDSKVLVYTLPTEQL